MLQWFFDLTPLYRILTLAVILSLVIFAVPSFKVNPRNLLKALLLLVAAVLLYFLWSGENPDNALEQMSRPSTPEKRLPSVPKYYEDPEKRWQDSR